MNNISFSTKQLRWYSYLIYWIIPLSGVNIDIYVPSLPHIMQALHTSQGAVQMTIALYSLGLALGQLIAGPLSDRFGRKPTMLIGAVLQAVFISLILLTQNIAVFIVMRFFQGLAISLLVVSARAMLSDLFSGDTFKKKINLLTIFWALGPIIAPAIGGYLQYYFDWQATFFMLLAYVISIFIFILLTAETHQNRQRLQPSLILKTYTTLAVNKTYMFSMLFTGVLAGFIILFNIISPFLVQTQLHHNAIYYGHIALSMGLAWLIGNSVNRLLFHVSFNAKASIVIGLMLVCSLTMWLIAYYTPLQIDTLVAPSFILILLAAILFPNLIGNALAPLGHIAGYANALLFSGMWFCGFLVTNLGALLHTSNMLPLASADLALSLFCMSCFFLLKRYANDKQAV